MYLTSVAADNNVVQGNFFGTDATGELDLGNGGYGIFVSQGETNQIGGFTAGAGNVISGNNSVGVVVANANGTQVVGNTIGTNLAGDTEISNFRGLQVLGGSTNTGVVDNLVSGNNALGILIDGPTTTSTTVQGNLIGVSRDQTTQIDNGQFGILLRSSSNTIGGAGAGEGNVISGAGNGIFVVLPTTTGNQIVGNFVGTDTTGANALGVDVGINIGGGATGNVVGPNNTIANNGTGVRNFSGGEGNQITENVMFGNTLIGIDIPGLGATPNDAGDADEGPNRKQNKADLLIASMTSQPGNTTQFDFDYSVDTDVANATYPLTVEFFLSDANGQGAQFLTADTYTATGPASHSVTIDNSQLLYLPEFATATVTDAAGNTSEFSLAIPIDSGMEAAFASPPPALQVAPFHAMDVNQDRQVSLSDALDVINTLSDQSAASGESARNAVFATDVSGDGATTPLDLLLILNHLSQERLSDQLISQLAMDASDDFSDEIAELERQHDEALSGFLF
jgi:hypothetical protein